jgi:hypothetical protein
MTYTEDDIKKRILALPECDRNELLLQICRSLYVVDGDEFDTTKVWSSDEIGDIGNAVSDTLGLEAQ